MSAEEYSFYEGLHEGVEGSVLVLERLLVGYEVMPTETAKKCSQAFQDGFLLGMCLTGEEVLEAIRGY